jgi:hypothetical protein
VNKGGGTITQNLSFEFGASYSNLRSRGFDSGVMAALVQTTQLTTGVTEEAGNNGCFEFPLFCVGIELVVVDDCPGLFTQLETGIVYHPQADKRATNSLNDIVEIDGVSFGQGANTSISTFSGNIGGSSNIINATNRIA